MAEKVELELKIKGGTQAVKTLGQLEQELNNARDAIKEVEVGSDAFKELATKIQNASSEVKTLEKQMEGLEPQQKTEAFLKLGEGIAGGFAMAQGAMGLMGVESEDLEKIQVKVQSAIAIAQGVRMMSEAALMFTTAKRVAAEKIGLIQTKIGTAIAYGQTVALGAWATVQGVLTGAITITSAALKVLKLAIVATGIGALVLAIIAIGMAVYDWATATDQTALAQSRLNKELVKNNEEYLKNRDYQKELSQANTKAEKDLVKLQKTLNDTTEELKTNSEQLLDNADRLENASDHTEESNKTTKRNSSVLAKNSITIKKNIDTLDSLILKKQEEIAQAEEAEETAKQNEADRKQRSSDRRSRRKSEAAELLSLDQELSLMRIEDDNKREAAKIELDRQNALTKAETAKNSKEQIALINEKFDILEAERQQKVVDAEFEKLIAKNDKFNEENLANNAIKEAAAELANQKEIDDAQAVTDAKITSRDQLTNAVSGSITEIGALFKEGSAAAKTAALTEIAINTALGFVQGLDIAQKSAKATGPAAAVAFPIFYATQIGAVLSAANKARGILGGGGGGGTSPDNPDTPDNITPASTGAFSLGGGLPEQQAVKAYVVTDEMSDSQAQLSDIRRRSTI